MTSTSETSFGARLRKSQDVLTYITGFTGYAPPRQQESIAGFTTLIASIVAINATESNQYENYKVAVDARQSAFLRKTGSVEKLLVPIKSAVEAHYGKNSVEVATVRAIIKKMRTTKLIKTPIDPENPDKVKTFSQSEHSYGSQTQFFNDIVNSITQFAGFNPSNANLKIPALQAFATQLNNLNNSVAQKTQVLKTTRVNRVALYADLKDRFQRIKAYVKAQYGTNSPEYNLIKNINL